MKSGNQRGPFSACGQVTASEIRNDVGFCQLCQQCSINQLRTRSDLRIVANRLTVRSDCSNVLVIQSAVSQQFIEGLCINLGNLIGAVLHTNNFVRTAAAQRKQAFAQHVRIRLKTAGNELTALFVKDTCDRVNAVHTGAGHHADVNRNIWSAHKNKGLIQLRPQILTSRLVRTCRS